MRVILALVAAVLAVPVTANGAGPRSCGDGLPPRNDGWQSIAAPPFAIGPTVLSGWTAAGSDPRTQYVTNGAAVLRSTDSGCTWRQVFAVTTKDPRESAPLPEVTEIGSVPTASGDLAYVVVVNRPAAPTLPPSSVEVSLSRDGGVTWTRADNGLPQVVAPVHLAFGPDGLHGYALLDVPALPSVETLPSVSSSLYATSDGGATWAPARGAPAAGLAGFVPGPGADLWAWDATGLLRSTDAGVTFAREPGVTGRVTAVALPASGPPLVFTPSSMWASVNGRWSRRAVAGRVDSAAYDPASRTAVGSGQDGLRVYRRVGSPARGKDASIVPAGDEYLRSVVLSSVSLPPQVWGFTHAAIFHGPLTPKLGVVVKVPPRPLPGITPIVLHPGDGPLPTHPVLDPPSYDVAMPVGTSRTVHYRLDLPPTPTPVDVDFLIDTTNSFGPIINALRTQLATIVNRLTALRIDAQFGVGAFREYPTSSYVVPTDDNYPYRRVRPIGPVNSQLEGALYALRTGGGTTDGRTSALAAEYQSVTGAGQTIAPTGDKAGYVIPPGLDARFRPKALRVVLLVTDTEPRQPAVGYPGPSTQLVADAMTARNVLQVGLVVGSPPQGVPGPRATMEDVARRTGAVATGDGIDCDGDGEVDLDPGMPLVCDLVGDGLSNAIVEMLRGIRDIADVDLSVSGDPNVVTPLSALSYAGVDVKAYNRIRFDVRYSCAGVPGGTVTPVRLAGHVAGAEVVAATARVRCLSLAAPPERVLPIPAALAVLAPPPPPAPVTHPDPLPHPNPNPQPNPQLQPHPQAGFAAQEQARPQLAFAGEDVRLDDELAMSRYEPPYRPLGAAAALAMGAAYGVAVRRRRRTQVARVTLR